MVSILVFILGTIGMSHILVDGSIFNWFKTQLENKPEKTWLNWTKGKLLELLNCYQCTGFWSGLFIGLLMWLCGNDPLDTPLSLQYSPMLFVYACAGGYISMKAAVATMWLQK